MNTGFEERNRRIFEYYRAHPDATYSEIAKQYGLSTQRVHYLIQRQFLKEAIKDRVAIVQTGEVPMNSDSRERTDDGGKDRKKVKGEK
jgi:DNA-binding Lrp family transcriptional regulator